MTGLSIGDLGTRTGLSVAAIRFHETHGIVAPLRNAGGHRRHGRADLRRLSFAMVAQRLGFSLAEIAAEMAHLPAHSAPSRADRARISTVFRGRIDARIATPDRLRDRLDGCIGCGCLSLDLCAAQRRRQPRGRGAGPTRADGLTFAQAAGCLRA